MKHVNILCVCITCSFMMISCWGGEQAIVKTTDQRSCNVDEMLGYSERNIRSFMNTTPAGISNWEKGSMIKYSNIVVGSYNPEGWINFYIDANGKCIGIESNLKSIMVSEIRREYKAKYPNSHLLWLLCPPLTIYGIPVAIWYAIRTKHPKKKLEKITGGGLRGVPSNELLAIGSTPTAPTVTNVRFEQVNNRVKITYSLDKTAGILVSVSTDGGWTYSAPLQQVSGDVGTSVSAGAKKTLWWDVLSERESLIGNSICFKVTPVMARH